MITGAGFRNKAVVSSISTKSMDKYFYWFETVES